MGTAQQHDAKGTEAQVPVVQEDVARREAEGSEVIEGFCEFCGHGPTCCVCGRGLPGRKLPRQEESTARLMRVAKLRVVHSTMKPRQNSIRTRNGGDPRGALDHFVPGEEVVLLSERDYNALLVALEVAGC